jgi:SPOR domain
MKLFINIFFVFLCCCSLSAQSITEDPAITQLMQSYVSYNQANSTVRGWRIQIMSTTDRRVMEETQSKFKRLYPEYELLFEHQNPYYHLKTGAFLSQLDTRPMLKTMQRQFPGAFVVADEFEMAEVLNYLKQP